jgi:hypothetical protein
MVRWLSRTDCQFCSLTGEASSVKSLRRHTLVKQVYNSAMPKRGKINKAWNSGGAAVKGYYGTYLMLFTRKEAILHKILFPGRRAWFLVSHSSEYYESIENVC